MAQTYPKTSGVFRSPSHIYAKSGGVWRDCSRVWMKVAGVWVPVFNRGGGSVVLTAHTEGGEYIVAQFKNNGLLNFHDNVGPIDRPASGEWLTSNPDTVGAANYDVMFTYVSGPNPTAGSSKTGLVTKTGDAYGTWLNLATTRQIGLQAIAGTISGSAGGTLVFTAAIRPAGGGATLASANITLQASSG